MALALQGNRSLGVKRRANLWDLVTCCIPTTGDQDAIEDNDTGYGSQDLAGYRLPSSFRQQDDPFSGKTITPQIGRRRPSFSSSAVPSTPLNAKRLEDGAAAADDGGSSHAHRFMSSPEPADGSLLDSFSGFMSKISKISKEYVGELKFSLYFNDQFQYLRVYLFSAKNLLPMDASGYSDPYVVMKLIPDKKKKQKSTVQFRTLNPKWEEEFYFRNLDYSKMCGQILKLTVMDYDRMSPDDPIGEVTVELSSLQKNDLMKLNCDLSKCCRSRNLRGQIQITTMYNPVGKTLRVTINQVRELKSTDVTGKADPYVVVKLVNNGKEMMKHRTRKFYNTLDATYDESFPFQLQVNQKASYSLHIKVKDYDKLKWDDEIGRVLIGPSGGKSAEEHWVETFSNPCKSITKWHDIKAKNYE